MQDLEDATASCPQQSIMLWIRHRSVQQLEIDFICCLLTRDFEMLVMIHTRSIEGYRGGGNNGTMEW
jgi:hypothetical protein